LAYLLRTNISVAVFTTLYSNPLTYVPLYYIAYKIGVWVIDGGNSINHLLSLQVISSWSFDELMAWFSSNLTYLAVGVPILGITLALMSYYAILYLWKLHIVSKRKMSLEQRQKRDTKLEKYQIKIECSLVSWKLMAGHLSSVSCRLTLLGAR
ncbi:MAG: DUF2062 domain-containing protein, partial [Neisseriaceae bacterium]|nr:DUF2062 domain-containing protein [Neisseriaceae bacterium]